MLHIDHHASDPFAIFARLTTDAMNVAFKLPYRVIDDSPDVFPGPGERLDRVGSALNAAFAAGGASALLASAGWRRGTPLP